MKSGAGFARAGVARCLCVLAPLVLAGGCTDAAIIVVAPREGPVAVEIDGKQVGNLAAGEWRRFELSRGAKHVTTTSAGVAKATTFTLKENEAFLVPAVGDQCFVLLDVTELYSAAGTSAAASRQARPKIVDRFDDTAARALPKNVWIDKPTKRTGLTGTLHVLQRLPCKWLNLDDEGVLNQLAAQQ